MCVCVCVIVLVYCTLTYMYVYVCMCMCVFVQCYFPPFHLLQCTIAKAVFVHNNYFVIQAEAESFLLDVCDLFPASVKPEVSPFTLPLLAHCFNVPFFDTIVRVGPCPFSCDFLHNLMLHVLYWGFCDLKMCGVVWIHVCIIHVYMFMLCYTWVEVLFCVLHLQCTNFVKSYGPDVIEIIADAIDPKTECQVRWYQ